MSQVIEKAAPRSLGRAVPRLEDRRLLLGQGGFMADLRPLPRIHHAAILRSPHAHARIVSIDAAEAEALPGVRAVLTGTELAGWMRPFSVVADHPGKYLPMAVDKVRYVGEPVAVVVAKNRYVAEDALSSIKVRYEALPAVVDAVAASLDEAPKLHEEQGTNVALRRTFRFGDPEAAFSEEGAITVSEELTFNRFTCMPLETYGVIGHFDPQLGAATAWANFQGPFSMHLVAAAAMRLPPNRFRLIVPADVGGGFGIKISIYPYICLMIMASRKAGVPVKWIEDRRENLMASSSGTDRHSTIELAARADGTVTAMRLRVTDNVGAYLRAPEPGDIMRPFGNYTGGYRIENVALDLAAVMTNKVPTGPNRGYSCGHLYHALEAAMDALAEKLGADPAELRRKNLLRAEDFPYTTPTGGYYDAGDFQKVLSALLERSGYGELRKMQRAARAEGRLVGLGLCLAVDPSASNMGYMSAAGTDEQRRKEAPKSGTAEAATLSIDYGGSLSLVLNTAPQGQGHETVAAQICADVFGIEPQQVSVTTGSDTTHRAWTIASGAYSSRFASTGASAVYKAACELRQKLLLAAAHVLQKSPDDLSLEGGQIAVRGGEPVSLRRIAGAVHWNPSDLPVGLEPGLTTTAYFNIDAAKAASPDRRVNSSGVYSFAADLAVVEIDRATCELKILKYVTVHDIGPLLNPAIVEGQIYGGAMHGLGGALYEELIYDKDGQLLTGSLMDYVVPTSAESLELDIGHVETPTTLTPLGARGVGEAATQTVPGALQNAVTDALRPLGARHPGLPITPSSLYEALSKVRS